MKKLFLLAASFVMGMAVMAQQKAEDLVKMDVESHDFGKIKQGVPVTTYFTITNISDRPVVIENAWAGCGCTTPEYSKEPIAPNGSAKVKVGYNAAAMGFFTKDVNIKLAGVDAAKVIKITGEVVATDAISATADHAAKETTGKVASPKPAAKKTVAKKPAAKG